MRTLTALVALVLCAGCATFEGDSPEGVFPYLDEVFGPHVKVHVPKALVVDGLQQAIDISWSRADEHCKTRGNDVGTFFISADTAFLDESNYRVTWRCCRPDDECCLNPKVCE